MVAPRRSAHPPTRPFATRWAMLAKRCDLHVRTT
jgi:hypothetical protein